MDHDDFSIGCEFVCADRRWRCTDIGTRVIVAICLEPREVVMLRNGSQTRRVSNDPADLNGPPYGVLESVFDETELPGCSPLPR